MKLRCRILCLLTLLLILPALSAQADLVNHGPHGEFFFDEDTGLYWFDPAVFADQIQVTIDLFATHSTFWSWAGSAQVDALNGRSSAGGVHLEEILGTPYLSGGVYRWLGLYDGSSTEGWILQSDDSPAFTTITQSSHQGGAASLYPGAWLVSNSDPAGLAVLFDVGDGGEYFYDSLTGLYWCDPVTFVGMTRPEIETWLGTNSDWRWAALAEVFALQGKMTYWPGPLTDVMGDGQMQNPSVARWIGYYAESGSPDGLILQTDFAPSLHFINAASTQGNVGSWSPGAWIVSDVCPTPTVDINWSRVKTLY
ncbi:MAG: hypothetical protein GY835_10705 [bacterium]|nr:hypothetical protein [bacterium]